ncbi:PKD domain-containing protein [Chitinophagaceae bacterium LWZ2-11]
MKGLQNRKGFFLLLLINLAVFAASGQQYLEFVENKGQWDKNIRFKGEMVTGSIALKPDGGYRVLLNNRDDLNAFGEYMHGHIDNSSGGKPTPKPPTTGGGGNKNQVAPFSSTTSSTSKGTSSDNSNSDNSDGINIRSHAYEVTFLNANPAPSVLPDKPLNSYNNYFIGNDKSKWAGNCKIYTGVTYKNVYPNIDVRYYTDNTGNLKYDLIVNPGGDPSRIALYIDGVDGIKTKSGQLIIKTSVDDVVESAPYSYQAGATGRKEVSCSYNVKGNIISFNLDKNISKESTLVIDPQLIFCTFTGSTVSNWGFTATYDGGGNFYAGGIVFGQGFPVSNGAYQIRYAGGNSNTGEGGGFDMGIMKFDPLGSTRIYATYLGGALGNDYPHSLVTDAAGNLIVGGKTTSSDYPATQPVYGPGGGFDIIITKLNAAGTALIGSRRIGGTGDDGVNIKNKYPPSSAPVGTASLRRNYGDDSRSEVIVDSAGNIYLASCTQSTDFQTTPNAIQQVNASANSGKGYRQDGVVIKTNADLSQILFSTYLGGSDDDAAFVLAIDPNNQNNLLVAGGTVSTDFPGNRTGVKFPTYQGGEADGFVALLKSDGSQLVKSSYWGTPGADIIFGVQYDKHGYPYIMGTTTGTWPTTSNVNFIQAGGKQFVAKLNPDFSDFVYSTVWGTPNANAPNISPTAFLVDRCENLYVSGWGGDGNIKIGYANAGTSGLTTTSNAIKRVCIDNSDFYFIVIEHNAQSQLYGSFFGQDFGSYPDHVDGGTSRFDPNGVIYQSVCANCGGGAKFPTTLGSWSPNNGTGGSGCNLAAIKIAFNLAGVGASVKSSIKGIPGKTSGCVPLDVNFIDTIAEGKTYVWNFGDGSAQQTTTTPNISHTYTAVGDYKVMLVSIDSSSCNIADTSYTDIRVRSDQATLGLNITKLPPCTALNYQFDNVSTAPATKPFLYNSFVLRYGDGAQDTITAPASKTHSYAAPGTYQVSLVLIDTNYCNAPDSFTTKLRISPNVLAQFNTPPTGCAPYTAVIENTSLAGQTFDWDFGDGTTSSLEDPGTHYYPNPGTYIIKLHVVDPNTCNQTSDTSVTITVYSKPVAAFTAAPQPPQVNTPIVFTNASLNGVRYKWVFGDGDTLITYRLDTLVSHIYNITGTFYACLTAYNQFGCDSTVCQDVETIISPLADVPNAFTPNGDGVNDQIFVRGFGIAKMTWRIFNRWGTMVFASTSSAQGWDGRYKGVMQPQDVYTYVLELQFSDGTKFSKKGDITLLR